jgi:hypothetical protein
MSKFTDHLWHDLVQEHGTALAHADRPEPGRAHRPRPRVLAGPAHRPGPRVLAGSTLALAGAGTALALGLTATGSTPAFAVTKNGDGSVLVQIDKNSALPQANAKLTAMGIHEQIEIQMASGPAPVNGPVNCAPKPAGAKLPGPPVKVLVGKDGTEVIAPGTTGNNTGVGTWHLAACWVTAGNNGTGNTGAG